MAISRVIKTLNNLSKAFKIDIGGDFFRERTKDYGKKIQDRLLDGLEGGYDIEGKTFKGMINQNEGFITGDKSLVPNRSVPARKWYGIPKTYREGGTQYELFLNKIIKEINNKIADAINES